MASHNQPPRRITPHEDLKIKEVAPSVVPPMYKLRDDDRTIEVLLGEHRILTWEVNGSEGKVANISGWEELPHQLYKDTGNLVLPVGTRNAKSVLSGMEAWEGQKAEVIDRGIDYLRDIKQQLGQVDFSFHWAAIGVTPDYHIFIAPPNLEATELSKRPEEWRRNLVKELGLLLQNDKKNKHLAESFQTVIDGLLQ
jgi:hypothetical protein